MKCPVCKKDFDEHTGRRPKKFCSDECKVKFWNAKKRVVVNNKPENKKRIEEERQTHNSVGEKHNRSQPIEGISEMEALFQKLKNEKK